MASEGYQAYRIKSFLSQPIMDEFTQYRLNKYGGQVQIYVIQCWSCQTDLFDYQKDGQGPLLRCYLDRILTTHGKFILADVLTCPNCHQAISEPQSIYTKTCPSLHHSEARPCYTLI